MALKLGRKRNRTARSKRPATKPITGRTAGTELLLAYPAYCVVTCELIIERMAPGAPEVAWDRRYENARAVVADWINACRKVSRAAFAHATFDVWISQECGVELGSTMQITIASRGRLPELPLLELLRERAEAAVRWWDWGQQPIELGAFPELRISKGTIANTWKLDTGFMALASERFRRWHHLSADVSDPYRQMLGGAPEPTTFEWRTLDTESEPRNTYIFEVVKDSEERKGMRITTPDKAVSVSDAYDLDDQLALADVDITASCFEPFQRLQYARYVRPALRQYCEVYDRPVPAFLANDSSLTALSPEAVLKLFGVVSLGIRKFQPLRRLKNIRVIRAGDPEENPDSEGDTSAGPERSNDIGGWCGRRL